MPLTCLVQEWFELLNKIFHKKKLKLVGSLLLSNYYQRKYSPDPAFFLLPNTWTYEHIKLFILNQILAPLKSVLPTQNGSSSPGSQAEAHIISYLILLVGTASDWNRDLLPAKQLFCHWAKPLSNLDGNIKISRLVHIHCMKFYDCSLFRIPYFDCTPIPLFSFFSVS